MIDIRKIRKDNDLTQQQMADMLGVERSSLSAYENGKTPIPGTVEKLVGILFLGKGNQIIEERIKALEEENRELKQEIKKLDDTMDEIKARRRRRGEDTIPGLEGGAE